MQKQYQTAYHRKIHKTTLEKDVFDTKIKYVLYFGFVGFVSNVEVKESTHTVV